MRDREQPIYPSIQRSRRRRARLKEAGVLTVTCELASQVGEQLVRAAELANMPPSHLAEIIIVKHFERVRGGQKRSARLVSRREEAG